MKTNNVYRDYPTNKPPRDDYYLVSVKPALISKLGLNPSPTVLIAKYIKASQEWTTVLGQTSIGVGNIAADVISWCDLPCELLAAN